MDECGHGHPLEVATWVAAGCELVLFVDSLGREHLRYQCLHCGRFSNGVRINLGRERLRIVESTRTSHYEPCSVRGCMNLGEEKHHFAPRSVFGWVEYDLWPVAALCHEHHNEWHDKMTGYDRYRESVQ